jgi:hypothetical protein
MVSDEDTMRQAKGLVLAASVSPQRCPLSFLSCIDTDRDNGNFALVKPTALVQEASCGPSSKAPLPWFAFLQVPIANMMAVGCEVFGGQLRIDEGT